MTDLQFRLLAVTLLLIATSGFAAKKKATPPSTTLFPAGAQVGTTSTLTLSSKIEGTGKGFAIDCPGVVLLPQTGNQVQCIVAPDAPLGLHLVHVFTDAGASEPRWFSIGTLPEMQEKEPNDSLSTPQRIEKLPICINGQLEKRGTADLFNFSITKGQTLFAHVEAYELGSLVDPELELRDDQGTLIASAHDARNLDPMLLYTAPRTANYTLQLAGFAHPPAADVSFVGAAGIIYRLQLTAGPTTLRVFPAAVSRKAKTKLQLLGTNLPKPIEQEFDGSTLPAAPSVQRITVPNAFTAQEVVVTDEASVTEIEPNNDAEHAMQLKLPACVGGRIAKDDAADAFAFDAKKGTSYAIHVYCQSIGLPLEAHVMVQDATGKELAASNDSLEHQDAELNFKAPADGKFIVKVSDLYGKGGDAAEYVLSLKPTLEDFALTITSKPTLMIEPGKTVEIKAKIKRIAGYAGELVLRAQNLPPGVTCADIEAPKKDGAEVTLKLEAATNALPANQPIQCALWTKAAKDKPLISHTGTVDLRGDNRRSTSMLDATDRLWLTVLPAP